MKINKIMSLNVNNRSFQLLPSFVYSIKVTIHLSVSHFVEHVLVIKIVV